jgi:membrane protein required for beta-lactamase induction
LLAGFKTFWIALCAFPFLFLIILAGAGRAPLLVLLIILLLSSTVLLLLLVELVTLTALSIRTSVLFVSHCFPPTKLRAHLRCNKSARRLYVEFWIAEFFASGFDIGLTSKQEKLREQSLIRVSC